MRFTAAAALTMAGAATASWSPDAGSHGGWGDHGAPAGPPSNGTWGGEDTYTTEVVTAFTTYVSTTGCDCSRDRSLTIATVPQGHRDHPRRPDLQRD